MGGIFLWAVRAWIVGGGDDVAFCGFVEILRSVRLSGRVAIPEECGMSKIRRGLLRASIGLSTQRLCVSDELVGGIPV